MRLSLPTIALVCATTSVGTTSAGAHNQWADGSAIPAWVKASCCGPADAHHLRPDQVHDMGDYYQIDGMRQPIMKTYGPKHFPNNSILPSQDGDYWVFYKDTETHQVCGYESRSCYSEPAAESVYCFFVPMNF